MDGYLHRMRHGGWCCGMTHIQGFHTSPDTVLPERKIKTATGMQAMIKESPHFYSQFNEDLPSQTGTERLKLLIERTIKGIPGQLSGRRHGIIEVVLAGSQFKQWDFELKTHGFVRVSEGLNSNSRNMLYVYHLVTGKVA